METKAEEYIQTSEKLVNQSRALSERVATYLQRTRNQNELLSGEVRTLKDSIHDVEAEFEEVDDVPVAAMENLLRAQHILHGAGPGSDLTRLLPPPKNPLVIHLLLGKNINVVNPHREESLKNKQDYYGFRDKHTIMFVHFSALLIVAINFSKNPKYFKADFSLMPLVKVLIQVYLCWLVYFYTTMSLRESVLKVNGSRIPNWWIYHHYWSVVTTGIMITLPVDSPAVDKFIIMYLWWAFAQGLVMILQNRYQRRRMYTRIALGKSSNMDIVGGDTSGTKGQLLLLYPLLFGLQGWQAYIGVRSMLSTYLAVISPEGWLDMETHESDLRGSRGIFACGLLFAGLSVANFHATFATIVSKRRYRQKQLAKKE